MTMRVESLEEDLERLDIDRHGGEVMAGTSVGHQIIEVDAAFIELFQNAQEIELPAVFRLPGADV